MYILLFVLITLINKSEASLELTFSEEFNENDSIDKNKWEIIYDTSQCNYLDFINCFVNNKTNVQISNGTLALTAIPQKYLNRYYTTPYISTKQGFTFGRFEMRAALPKAKMLKTLVFFQALTKTGLKWPQYGEIQWINNNQIKAIFSWLTFNRNGKYEYLPNNVDIEENLFEFNNYTFEWTETQLQWIFNDRVLTTFNITKELENNYNPFDKPFKLSIYLGIGGDAFPGQILSEEDLKNNWPCSLLIIDYIRVYQNKSESTNNSYPVQNSPLTKSSSICKKIMPTILPKFDSWKFIVSDEFEGNLDKSIWNIEEGELCETNENETCHLSNTGYFKFANETLTMAIFPNLNNLEDSKSALITTKQSFKFGRFVIRAALPEGNLLRPSIFMTNQDKSKEINMLSYTSSNQIYLGIQYPKDLNKKFVGKTFKKSEISKNLFDFHTYVMEWTETEIRWFVDEIKLYTTTLIQDQFFKIDNQFVEPLKLSIKLEVEPNPLIHIVTNESDPNLCLMLIVDYVRIFEQTDHNSSYESFPEQNLINSSLICGKNKALKVKDIDINPSPISLIPIISISSVSIILVLIGIFICLYIRLKNKLKSKLRTEQNVSKENEYGDVELDSHYENPYEIYNNNYDNTAYEQINGRYLEIQEYHEYQNSDSTLMKET